MASVVSPLPASLLLLLLVAAAAVVSRLAARPPLPSTAPRLLKGWPLLGSTDFFRARGDFLRNGRRQVPGGQFSFYYGPHPIVAVSGPAARSFFYTTRGLDLTAGFAALFAAAPSVEHLADSADLSSNFSLMLRRLMHPDRLAARVGRLAADCDTALRGIDTSAPVEPFALMMRLVYQLTHRTLGCDDIADNPALLARTLAIYGRMGSTSGIDVMLPGLPTPNRLRRMWAGFRLHRVFQRIMAERRVAGPGTDAMQVLMDQGESDIAISSFIIGALFAGVVNSGFNAAWILCFLADDPYWLARMRAEVDAAVTRHRLSNTETATDVLHRLSMEEWESEFPLIGLGLRDSIRLITPAVSIRKNISGKDVEIAGTDRVIPSNAFAVYPMDDIHMDPRFYRDPLRWDPGRYLPDREEDKKAPHAYLGWGSGLHPCLGTRFAKLEITMSTALFLARYDFRLCDRHGSDARGPLPHVDRNAIGDKRPPTHIFLKCSPRF